MAEAEKMSSCYSVVTGHRRSSLGEHERVQVKTTPLC